MKKKITLIELLVVIAIIAILSVIVYPVAYQALNPHRTSYHRNLNFNNRGKNI